MQRKLCLIDCPGLVDFAIRLVNFVLKVPNGKVKFLGKFNLHKTGLLIFRAVAELRKSGKYSEIHKNMKNTAKFGRNLIKYMSVQHI